MSKKHALFYFLGAYLGFCAIKLEASEALSFGGNLKQGSWPMAPQRFDNYPPIPRFRFGPANGTAPQTLALKPTTSNTKEPPQVQNQSKKNLNTHPNRRRLRSRLPAKRTKSAQANHELTKI